jgi:hypothetical protein
MRYTSSLRSPKKEEHEVPNFNKSYTHEDFYIFDELEEYLNEEEDEDEQKLSPQNTCNSSNELHWDLMEWDEFSFVEGKDENISKCNFDEKKVIKRENYNDGFWEVDDEKSVSLNLNLNYQEVLDAWSDRGSLWADDCSLNSLSSSNNCSYVSTHYPIFTCISFNILFSYV